MNIRVLSPDTAAKIAAGEVIIRPASVVKELMENSLDAGASKIAVYLEKGGKGLIRLTDDGEGISPADIELAVKRFATSKLESADDLIRIASYGFRGEALASMAEVSELTIETQVRDAESGVMLKVKAGQIIEHREMVRAPGTTVTARNLFFNLPARRAFLKGEPYERRLVLAMLKNYALLHYRLHFTASNPRGDLINYPACDEWLDRIKDIYPSLADRELIVFSEDHRLLSIRGVITAPGQSVEGPRIQHTFFNSRPVQYRSVYRAIMQGYAPLTVQNPPSFVIKIECPAHMLDANIHPTKTEVRYREERFLFDFSSQAVRKAVHAEARENLDVSHDPLGRNKMPFDRSQLSFSAPSRELKPYPADRIGERLDGSKIEPIDPDLTHRELTAPDQPSYSGGEHSGFWQLQGTYILAQTSSGLIIVDQHAAHERILYEEMLERMGENPARQPLLFPLIVDLSPEEFATFEEIASDLSQLGFDAKPFGPNQVILETLPADARISAGDLRELFGDFNANQEVRLGNRNKMAALITCRAAIKAGRVLSRQEMESLINRLFCCKTPFFCPHGRPTVIRFTMEDLDKRFGRI